MRLGLVGLVHEANTFAPEVVDAEVLERATRRGAAVLAEHQGARTSASGFLCLAGPDVEIVPLVVSYPNPSGVITAGAFGAFLDEMRSLLDANGPFDGLLMPLHGAGVAEGDPDIETTMLRAAREVVGQDVPIAVTFDMHGNIAPETGELADVVTAYQTNPHVDSADRGERAGQLLVDAVRNGRCPVTVVHPIPVCVTILRQATDSEPMASILRETREISDRLGCLDVSVMEGFPYADVPSMGMSAIVVAGQRETAARAAAEVADVVWSHRQELDARCMSVDEAVALAAADTDRSAGPILLLDVGDNIGGGAPGDSVELLRGLLEAEVPGVLALVNDPQAVTSCWSAGIGAGVRLAVGGCSLASPSAPVVLDGRVWSLREGPWVDRGTTHMGQNWFDAGRCAVLRVGEDSHVLLTSRVQIPSGLGQARAMGVDPAEANVVIGKGVNSPLAGYGPIARRIVQVDTPGITRASYEALGHQQRPRPLFPFER